MIRSIRLDAQKELKDMLGCSVDLELFVRVEKKFLPMNTPWQFLGVVVIFLLALLVAIAWTKLKENVFRRIRLNQ